MKKLTILFLLCLPLCGCFSFRDPVIDAFPGELEGQVWTSCGFQDYTNYGKFTCSGITPEMLEDNLYFQILTAGEIPTLEGFLENYEGWIELEQDCKDCNVSNAYDFSAALFQPGDYFYLYAKRSDWPYSNYDLYYFSMATQTLYYFHNNI